MYFDVMSYVVREPEIRHIYMSSEKVGFRKMIILHETELVGKQCPDDPDQHMKDQ